MRYKAYYRINNKEKFLDTFGTYDEAFEYCKEHREKNSKIVSYYRRMFKKGNRYTIDYGSHNAFYIIEEEI